MSRFPLLTLSALVLCGASALAASVPSPSGGEPITLTRQEARGLAFARANCAACHAVVPNSTSPNPESPPFEDIANRPGITRKTLGAYLKDAHNFPEAMNFTVSRKKIGDLSAWIMRMQQPDYRQH